MVFCGTPSKACAPCRARKTKCDQSIPSCGQCLRSGRTCMGYRDEQSMVFRDETKKVVRKANAARTANRSSSSAAITLDEAANHSERSTRDAGVSLGLTTQAHNQIDIRNPPVALDDQSACFYFHNFTYSGVASPLNVLPAVFKQAAPGSPLVEIIMSIGMAAMANKFKCPEMMFDARRRQTSVLRAINVALQSQEEAKTDFTLTTVVLLGCFEIVTGSGLRSLDYWTNHIKGATAIAQTRGRKQLESNIGRRIFNILRNHVLIGCLQRDVAVPQVIIDWSHITIDSASDGEIYEQRLFLATARLCSLRSDFMDQENHEPNLVDRAHTVDADLEDWVNRLPCEYAYIPRKSSKTNDGFLDYYHVYRDLRVAGLWNMYRCARILAHEVIMKRVDRRSMTTVSPSAQRRKSEAMIAQLSDDVAASVPFYLQGDHLQEHSSYNPKTGLVGQQLLWPLFLIARISQPSSLLRIWVIVQLNKIGHITGVHQNIAIAKTLKERLNEIID